MSKKAGNHHVRLLRAEMNSAMLKVSASLMSHSLRLEAINTIMCEGRAAAWCSSIAQQTSDHSLTPPEWRPAQLHLSRSRSSPTSQAALTQVITLAIDSGDVVFTGGNTTPPQHTHRIKTMATSILWCVYMGKWEWIILSPVQFKLKLNP